MKDGVSRHEVMRSPALNDGADSPTHRSTLPLHDDGIPCSDSWLDNIKVEAIKYTDVVGEHSRPPQQVCAPLQAEPGEGQTAGEQNDEPAACWRPKRHSAAQSRNRSTPFFRTVRCKIRLSPLQLGTGDKGTITNPLIDYASSC